MKIAAVLARHRRLLALCGLSLLAHALVIEWIAVRVRPSPAQAPSPDVLAIRLRPAAVPAEATRSVPAVAARPAQAVPAAAAPSPPPPVPTEKAHAVSLAPRAPAPDAAPATASVPADATDDAPLRMPGRYRVRIPPPALLTYVQTRSRPGQPAAPAGAARIAWQTDGDAYTLHVEGVLGKLASEGGSSDAGIAPRVAHEERDDGSRALTRFDQQARRILFDANGRSAPPAIGAQDRASVLMQLTGIGLADPGQIGNVIEIVVAGAADATVARFKVLGREDLATGLGPIGAWHLVQLARPGEPLFEVWLAPERGWYPAQLRVTAPDGTASTQVLARIDPAQAGAPPAAR